ncbi:MAG: hypothetical protein PVJ33_03565 [Lysobacterales bacterium]
MKMLTGLIAASLFSASFVTYAGMGMGGSSMMGSGMGQGSNGQVSGMMSNPDTRAQVMNQIAGNPQMRQEMLQKMMHAMGMGQGKDLQQMMNQPGVRSQMQHRMEMMQAMLGSDGMNPQQRRNMMNDPQMRSAMMQEIACGQMAAQNGHRGMHGNSGGKMGSN